MRSTSLSFAVLLSIIILQGSAFCQEKAAGDANESSAAKATTVDPEIPLDQLKVAVKPLTRAELESEVKGWFQLLRDNAGAIAESQLEVKETAQEEAAAEEAAAEAAAATDAAGGETAEAETADAEVAVVETAVAEAEAEQNQQMIDALVELKQNHNTIIAQLEVVLESFEEKGGNVEEYRQYILSQSGVEIDTSDAGATWIAIKSWLTSDEGGMKWAWRFGAFFLILLITKLITGIVSALVHRWLARTSHMSKLAESLVAKSIHHVIMLLGFLIALTALGIDIGPLLAAVGATGFIVGFALQGTLSNFASGLMILLNRPFDVGDVVTAGGVTGKVAEMSLVSTTFSTFDNQKIIVPNNEIWGNVITNANAQDTRRVDLVFGVGYDDNVDQVEQILKDAVKGHPLVLDEPETVIQMNELADSSINFICRPWVKSADYWTVYWDLLKTVKSRFDEAGISIPYPQQDIHVISHGAEAQKSP
jgi:small conductance mechanosensitive channel